jgi:hypothetical protein
MDIVFPADDKLFLPFLSSLLDIPIPIIGMKNPKNGIPATNSEIKPKIKPTLGFTGLSTSLGFGVE